jgi:hypothetical protein
VYTHESVGAVRRNLLRSARCIVCVLTLSAAISPLGAQEPEIGAVTDAEQGRRWWTLWSRPSDQDRLIWGMWTLHVNYLEEGWSNDGVVAAIYKSVYAASFETTHGPRGYTLGFERIWGSVERGPVQGMVGFRTGLVYGYDHRLGWMAEKYPILPFAQPVFLLRAGPLTTDFTYTWVVVSFTVGVRF